MSRILLGFPFILGTLAAQAQFATVPLNQAERQWYWRAEMNYIVTSLYNPRLQLGVQHRSGDAVEVGLPDSQTIYLGLRTNMYELYQDF
ncbi:MAG: hypothetical protein DA408_21485 [Bacteroidetes bacterium]|nr:MAG: hypothetical protein C7N36_18305 [Bacteroidota bacterium]PTM07788.1 MAG: hypothetical protein DA408_21485 [Bacteroidota bacterium]